MQNDKQIYAYSWQKDLRKKVGEYFKKTFKQSPKVFNDLEETKKPIEKPIGKSAKEIRADMKSAEKSIKNNDVAKLSKPNKQKVVNNISPLIQKERQEKTLTLTLILVIITVMGSAIYAANELVIKPIPATKTPAFELISATPTEGVKRLTPIPKTSVTPVKSPIVISPPTTGCKISGCNSEICADESLGEISSICLYEERFECYKSATCERQINGKCGWTQTEELDACLVSYY